MSDGVKDSVKLFYSYAHEDGALRDELDKYLTLLKKNGIIDSRHDRRMTAGTARWNPTNDQSDADHPWTDRRPRRDPRRGDPVPAEKGSE